MATTRLTISIRESLTRRLMEHAFAGRCVTHFKAELDFAEEVFEDVMLTRTVLYRGEKMPVGKVVAELPAGWSDRADYFYVDFAGQKTKLDKYEGLSPKDGYREVNRLIGVKVTPHHEQVKWHFWPGCNQHQSLAVYDASHPFSKRAEKLASDRADLITEIKRAQNSTRSTLNQVNSIQRLIVLWPEVEAFARVYLNEETSAKVLLPVIARDRLNETLGLPPGEVVV